MPQDGSGINYTVLAKGKEKYIWIWADGRESEVMQSIGKMAADRMLSLDWKDAARVVRSVRNELT